MRNNNNNNNRNNNNNYRLSVGAELIPVHALKSYRGMEVLPHSFLISILGEVSGQIWFSNNSSPPPEERELGIYKRKPNVSFWTCQVNK